MFRIEKLFFIRKKLLYMLLFCSKHVEVDYRNKLRKKNASCLYLLRKLLLRLFYTKAFRVRR